MNVGSYSAKLGEIPVNQVVIGIDAADDDDEVGIVGELPISNGKLSSISGVEVVIIP
jgi:hypothetical protein